MRKNKSLAIFYALKPTVELYLLCNDIIIYTEN
jgi:hypothetical protein